VLVWYVVAYIAISVMIGLLAARRVQNVKDYARQLLYRKGLMVWQLTRLVLACV